MVVVVVVVVEARTEKRRLTEGFEERKVGRLFRLHYRLLLLLLPVFDG